MSYRIALYLSNGIKMESSTNDYREVDAMVNAFSSAWGSGTRRGMIIVNGDPRMLVNPEFVSAITITKEGGGRG
jgi:hypothetical protein